MFIPAIRLLVVVLIGGWVLPLWAGDWPQWRGPQQSGISPETGLNLNWGDGNPKILWRKSLGTGVSAASVAGDRVYTMGNIDDKDIVYCLDAVSGREIWTYRYPCSLDARMFEGGPGATPTVADGRVYTISHEGHLHCLDAATGKVVWSKHLVNDFKGRRARWGYSCSPVVEGNMLIVDVGAVGASTVAFDKATGQTLWAAGHDEPGYSSPLVIDHPGESGKRMLLIFKANAIVGKDVSSGRELWRFRWATSYSVNATMPLYAEGKLFLTTGYGQGSGLLDISGARPVEVWRNKEMSSQVASPVLVDGVVYGFHGQVHRRNTALKAMEFATGKTLWEHPGLGAGTLIVADGRLIVLSEQGQLLIAPASAQGFQPVAQAKLLSGTCWVPPTLSQGRLYLRSNQGEMVVVDVK